MQEQIWSKSPFEHPGLTNAVSITTIDDNIYSVLDEDKVKHGFDGSAMAEINQLGIERLNPVAISD